MCGKRATAESDLHEDFINCAACDSIMFTDDAQASAVQQRDSR